MDREEYEKDLRRRQKEHLKKVRQGGNRPWRPCMHDGCPECHGTGVKLDGSACIHMISCPCPKCTPYSMACSKLQEDYEYLREAVVDYAKNSGFSNVEKFPDTMIRHRREYHTQLAEDNCSVEKAENNVS